MQLLAYTIEATSSDASHPSSNLEFGASHAQRQLGWRSAPNSTLPQSLTLEFEGAVRMWRLVLCSHEFCIARKLELLVGRGPAGCAAGECEWTRIGKVLADDNFRNDYGAREVLDVRLGDSGHSTAGRFLRIRARDLWDNELNSERQVGIAALSVFGEFLRLEREEETEEEDGQTEEEEEKLAMRAQPVLDRSPPPLEPWSSPAAPPAPPPPASASLDGYGARPATGGGSLSPARSPATMATAAAAMRASELFRRGGFDASVAQTVEELTLAKVRSVRMEDYETAKAIKDVIGELEPMGQQLGELEARKAQAIAEEDFEEAGRLKQEVLSLRAECASAAIPVGAFLSRSAGAGNAPAAHRTRAEPEPPFPVPAALSTDSQMAEEASLTTDRELELQAQLQAISGESTLPSASFARDMLAEFRNSEAVAGKTIEQQAEGFEALLRADESVMRAEPSPARASELIGTLSGGGDPMLSPSALRKAVEGSTRDRLFEGQADALAADQADVEYANQLAGLQLHRQSSHEHRDPETPPASPSQKRRPQQQQQQQQASSSRAHLGSRSPPVPALSKAMGLPGHAAEHKDWSGGNGLGGAQAQRDAAAAAAFEQASRAAPAPRQTRARSRSPPVPALRSGVKPEEEGVAAQQQNQDEPADLADYQRKDALQSGLVGALDERSLRCAYSRRWQHREAALNLAAAAFSEEAPTATRQRKRQLQQAACELIRRTYSDQIVTVFDAGRRLLAVTLELLLPSDDAAEVNTALRSLLPRILARLGDSSARVRQVTAAALMSIALHSDAGLAAVATVTCELIGGGARREAARLGVLRQLVRTHGVGGRQRGLTIAAVCAAAVGAMRHKDGDVRNAATLIAVELLKAKDCDERLVLGELRPIRRSTLDAIVAAADGDAPPAAGDPRQAQALAGMARPAADLQSFNGGIETPNMSPIRPSKQPADFGAPKVTPEHLTETASSRRSATEKRLEQPALGAKIAVAKPVAACPFCQLEDASLGAPRALDAHCAEECVMLCLCKWCGQVVEVSDLEAHKSQECEGLLDLPDGGASLEPSRGSAPGSSKPSCSLCGADVGGGSAAEWRAHLSTCAKQRRNQLPWFRSKVAGAGSAGCFSHSPLRSDEFPLPPLPQQQQSPLEEERTAFNRTEAAVADMRNAYAAFFDAAAQQAGADLPPHQQVSFDMSLANDAQGLLAAFRNSKAK